MDTDEGKMMVWICVEEYWIGLKIIDMYEWIKEICGINCIDIKEQCALCMHKYSHNSLPT